MTIANCRGDARKRQIIRRYEIEVGPRCVMLPHQRSEGSRSECCRQPLNDEFWQFFYHPKSSARYTPEYPEETGTFFVGRDCGKSFIRLLNEENPHLNIKEPTRFNPLSQIGHGGGGGGGGEGAQPLTALNQEVWTAINLMAVISRSPLSPALNRAMKWLKDHPDQDTEDWCLEMVNRIIGKSPDFNGRSLRQAMEDESALGGVLWRNFDFVNFEHILRDSGVVSHIDPHVEIPDSHVLRRCCTVTGVRRAGAWVVCLEDDDREADLYGDRVNEGDDHFSVGDRLLVRVSHYRQRLRVEKVYDRISAATHGEIKYVSSSYAFLSANNEGRDVFIPFSVFSEMGEPPKGTKVAVRTVDAEPSPQAVWGVRLDRTVR